MLSHACSQSRETNRTKIGRVNLNTERDSSSWPRLRDQDRSGRISWYRLVHSNLRMYMHLYSRTKDECKKEKKNGTKIASRVLGVSIAERVGKTCIGNPLYRKSRGARGKVWIASSARVQRTLGRAAWTYDGCISGEATRSSLVGRIFATGANKSIKSSHLIR